MTDPRDLKPLTLKVLVAEDNALNQRYVKRLLEKWGSKVTIVGNGEEAVRAATAERFDLILMDIHLPDLDGLESTRKIRAAEAQAGGYTPIIATTGNTRKGDREQCLREGMDAYLPKPISPQSLKETIISVVGSEKCAGPRLER